MTDSTKELMDARFCTLVTWRKERTEALMLMTQVGAAIARGNEELRRAACEVTADGQRHEGKMLMTGDNLKASCK